MTKSNRISLPEPLIGHGDPIRELVFRDPSYDDYVTCGGEPYTIGQSEDGTLFQVEKPEVIWAYAKACLVQPNDPLLLEQLGPGTWSVAREVRKLVLGFFQAPAAGSGTSPTSPTTSSSS